MWLVQEAGSIPLSELRHLLPIVDHVDCHCIIVGQVPQQLQRRDPSLSVTHPPPLYINKNFMCTMYTRRCI